MSWKDRVIKLNTPLAPGSMNVLLWGCFILTLLLRLWYGFYGSPVVSRDGLEYIGIIKEWEQSGQLQSCWYISAVPFYFFRLGAYLTGDIAAGILVTNILFGTLMIFPLYGLCRAFDVKKEISLATVFIYAVFTNFIEINAGLLRESCGLFFLISGLFCVAEGVKKDKILWWGAAGLFFVPAIFSRLEFLEINLVILLFCLLLLFFKKIKLSRLFVWAGGYLAGALISGTLFLLLLAPSPKEMLLFYDLAMFRFRVNTKSSYIEKPQNVPEYHIFH